MKPEKVQKKVKSLSTADDLRFRFEAGLNERDKTDQKPLRFVVEIVKRPRKDSLSWLRKVACADRAKERVRERASKKT